ncbi:DUF3225 domain-containing protein [Erwinia pyrifoliae]
MKNEAINQPATVAEVTAAFSSMRARARARARRRPPAPRPGARALVSNDIAVLDELFWHDERTVRLGAGENLYGIEAIRAFRAARPSAGLDRQLHNTVITTFGDDFAVCSTEFTRPGSEEDRPPAADLGQTARRLAHCRGTSEFNGVRWWLAKIPIGAL